MKVLRKIWAWIMKHAVLIIVALLLFLYVYASLQSIKVDKIKSDDDFRCQTLCFPQQHEHLFAGDTASCWCYESKDTLKKLTTESE